VAALQPPHEISFADLFAGPISGLSATDIFGGAIQIELDEVSPLNKSHITQNPNAVGDAITTKERQRIS
jgi:hypothetical protein